jgi:hypothetical protein
MKTFIVTVMLLLIIVSTQAQHLKTNEIPQKVQQGFKNKFPEVKKVKWSKENTDEFEAEYKINGIEKSSNFDKDGQWLVTETEIKSEQLPVAVMAVIKKDFSDFKIEEAEKAETASNQLFYEVTLEKKESNLEVKFSPEGKIISKEEKKESKD